MTSTATGSGDSLTPEASKKQVVDGATDIVRSLDLRPSRVLFWRASCNDQHEAPFRGVVAIWLPLAPDVATADAESTNMVSRLSAAGWTGDSDFTSHAKTVEKDGVAATFAPQNPSAPNRTITLYGECGDTQSAAETQPAEITLDT